MQVFFIFKYDPFITGWYLQNASKWQSRLHYIKRTETLCRASPLCRLLFSVHGNKSPGGCEGQYPVFAAGPVLHVVRMSDRLDEKGPPHVVALILHTGPRVRWRPLWRSPFEASSPPHRLQRPCMFRHSSTDWERRRDLHSSTPASEGRLQFDSVSIQSSWCRARRPWPSRSLKPLIRWRSEWKNILQSVMMLEGKLLLWLEIHVVLSTQREPDEKPGSSRQLTAGLTFTGSGDRHHAGLILISECWWNMGSGLTRRGEEYGSICSSEAMTESQKGHTVETFSSLVGSSEVGPNLTAAWLVATTVWIDSH